MISYAGLPALLAALAVFAWCIRKVKLPGPLETMEKLGRITSRDRLKALGKRLEALGMPVSPELFSAGRIMLTALPVFLGLFLLLDRSLPGVFFLFAAPMIGKFPELVLDVLEKNRKEEIRKDFPLMVDQVKIYAKAAGYYSALKIVSKSFKGSLGKELAVLSAEMEMIGLKEAMSSFAARCGIHEIADFARIIAIEQATGADIGSILANYSNMARQRQVSKIKRKIKIQPILMSVLPGTLLIIFILMLIIPMVTSIINQINAIK
ncbi:MAG: type II secretion system F family protein [Peptococcaceae bacterium]|nr:type II secretion system F family protein [Peptococcaceae bacterium]